MTGFGTKRTCRAGLRMSVDWGRPEAAGEASTDAIDPSQTFDLTSIWSRFRSTCGFERCDLLNSVPPSQTR
jgi:hypothetical protein